MATSNAFHILLNVQGLRDKLKRARLKEYLSQQKADIAFLQETHFSSDMQSVLKDEFQDWTIYNSYGDSKSKGCAILIKKQFQCQVINTHSSDAGRYIFMDIECENNTYSLLNIYAPNDKKCRNAFFTQISTLLLEHSEGVKLIGGDFNETLNNHIDRTSRSIYNTINTNKNSNLTKLIKEQ